MNHMPLAFSDADRTTALTSIQRYFREERGEELGSVAADALLDFFLRELAPSVYNQGVREAQERVQQQVTDLDLDLRADEFGYWRP